MTSNSTSESGDAGPTASRQTLEARARWLRRLREFFWSREFVEVETPMLSRDSVIDRHLDPIPVQWSDREPTYYLQTSPEFGMKRLLLTGLPAIFQITHAFRLGERGDFHNPEFTMCEWYRVDDGYAEGQQLLCELAEAMFAAGTPQVLSYREAFVRYADIDPFVLPADELICQARPRLPELAHESVADVAWWCDALFAEVVQPNLGKTQPTLLNDFPASQAALARVSQRDYGAVAERFELFVAGVELANGYHELLDAEELLRRNRQTNLHRQAAGKPMLPEASRLLSAMKTGLPACSGVALGVDRSLQVVLQKATIEEVLAFPIERA